ncbi:NADPH:quinone reductase [Azospirillaceae bacterium]
MKAMVIDGFGGSDRLQLREVPIPSPEPDEILIKVRHTAVNPVDWKIREGWLSDVFPHEFPLIPGWDVAGDIVAIGDQVPKVHDIGSVAMRGAGDRFVVNRAGFHVATRRRRGATSAGFSIGDPVYAYCRKPLVRWGSYAEYVTVSADAAAPAPSNLSSRETATIPLVGLTAWQALFDAARLASEQTILIHAASGGVGGMAVQFAKQVGARVIATAGLSNHAYVRSLGADEVIDYSGDSVAERVRAFSPGGVDVVLDTLGGSVLAESYGLIRPGGVLVSVVDMPDELLAEDHSIRTAFVFVSPNGGQLRRIAQLLEKEQIRPLYITEMMLEDAARAQDLSRAGHVRGKITLRVAFG